MLGPSIFRFVALAAFIVSVAFALSIVGVARVWIVIGIAAAFLIAVAVEWVTLREADARWAHRERIEPRTRYRAAPAAPATRPAGRSTSSRAVGRTRSDASESETEAEGPGRASEATAVEPAPERPSTRDEPPLGSEELEREAAIAEAVVPKRDEPPEEAVAAPATARDTEPGPEPDPAEGHGAAEPKVAPDEELQPPPEPEPEPVRAGSTRDEPEEEPEPTPRADTAAPPPRSPVPPRPLPPRPAAPPPARRPHVLSPPREAGQSPVREPGVVRLSERRREPRAWNVWDLERLVREEARRSPARADEWSYLLLHLREFAEAGGDLPPEFDGLVRESFGPLLERLEPA